MYKKMVVLLDGSELAEVVFDYAQEVSGRMHVDIDLLHVCTPQEVAQLPMRQAYMQQKAEELCARAEEVRAKYDKTAVAQCIQARGNVVVGYPAEEILEFIDEHDVDLVMMSTHGSSGVKGWDLGEVTNKVVHSSKVPVWLVPTELREELISDTLPRRMMVIPLSGSKQSEAAIPHGVSILKQRGAESGLTLIHVVEPPAHTVTRAALDAIDQQRADAKKYLESIAQPIRDQGLKVETKVLSGEPAEEIINFLKDTPTQLLVMSSRGKSRLNRTIFGSVTESVIHMVKVTPLLLVGGEQ